MLVQLPRDMVFGIQIISTTAGRYSIDGAFFSIHFMTVGVLKISVAACTVRQEYMLFYGCKLILIMSVLP